MARKMTHIRWSQRFYGSPIRGDSPMYPFRRRLTAAADLPTPRRVGRDSSARSVTSAAQRVPLPDMRKFSVTTRQCPGLASVPIRAAKAVA